MRVYSIIRQPGRPTQPSLRFGNNTPAPTSQEPDLSKRPFPGQRLGQWGAFVALAGTFIGGPFIGLMVDNPRLRQIQAHLDSSYTVAKELAGNPSELLKTAKEEVLAQYFRDYAYDVLRFAKSSSQVAQVQQVLDLLPQAQLTPEEEMLTRTMLDPKLASNLPISNIINGFDYWLDAVAANHVDAKTLQDVKTISHEMMNELTANNLRKDYLPLLPAMIGAGLIVIGLAKTIEYQRSQKAQAPKT